MKSKNYDMSEMRKELITLLESTLNKSSKFYKEDYENICKVTNEKNRKELIDAINRWDSVSNCSMSEINKNCQF